MDITQQPISFFPEQLWHMPNAPEQLWFQGSLPAPGTKYLTVVGSRALTSYGRSACESLIAGLAGYPICIVSGLAFGADACAHRAAMRAGLPTIAIPGSGLSKETLYPRAHIGLARDILRAGGALISEHKPSYAAHPYDFPSRNRIMVGFADAVLMIEAGDRSGTLITGRFSGEYNRHLLCIPHRIGDPNGTGPNAFMRAGATLVTAPEHILEALRIPVQGPSASKPLPTLSEDEETILHALRVHPTRDELLRASPLPPSPTLSALILLQIKGIVTEDQGRWRRAPGFARVGERSPAP